MEKKRDKPVQLKLFRKSITWGELMKYRREITLTSKLTEDEKGQERTAKILKAMERGPGCFTMTWFVDNVGRKFKPYVNATDEEMKALWLHYYKMRTERKANLKYWEQVTRATGLRLTRGNRPRAVGHKKDVLKPGDIMRSFDRSRIYPLKKETYQEIAERIYRARRRPTWAKRKITGVRFGEPMTSRYGSHRGAICERWIGLFPYVCKGDGKARLILKMNGEDRVLTWAVWRGTEKPGGALDWVSRREGGGTDERRGLVWFSWLKWVADYNAEGGRK